MYFAFSSFILYKFDKCTCWHLSNILLIDILLIVKRWQKKFCALKRHFMWLAYLSLSIAELPALDFSGHIDWEEMVNCMPYTIVTASHMFYTENLITLALYTHVHQCKADLLQKLLVKTIILLMALHVYIHVIVSYF